MKNIFRIFVLALIPLLWVASCSKEPRLVEEAGKVKVKIVNAAAGSLPQDFYLNNNVISTSAVAYKESTAYIETAGGDGRIAEFKNKDSGTANFTGTVNLVPGQDYTFFYTGKFSGSGNSSAVFKDDKSNPSVTRARVRFVNLAAGFDYANLTVSGGSNVATNVEFGTASTFNEVDPGAVNLVTSLYTSPATTISVGSFTFEAGKFYTVYTSGSLSGTVSAGLVTY